MKVNLSNVSFKRYTPVRIYVKDRILDAYAPITYKDKIKGCGALISKNLNKTLKNTNTDFVDYLASYDKDYLWNPKVRILYDTDTPNVYLATGRDAEEIEEYFKKDGNPKRKPRDYFGHMIFWYPNAYARNDYYNARKYLKDKAKRIKDDDKNPLVLTAYFDVKYDKDKHDKNYLFRGAEFVKSVDGSLVTNPNLEMIPKQKQSKQMTIFDLLDENKG